VRGHERQLHEHHSGLLPAAEVADGQLVRVPLQAVLAQLVAHRLVGLLVEQAPQVGDRRLVHGQALHEVLVVHAHAQARVAADLALWGLQLVGDQLDDRTAAAGRSNKKLTQSTTMHWMQVTPRTGP
jgi:hypothetical protein